MLLDGLPLKNVARFLREHGDYLDVSEESVIRTLSRWRKAVKPGLLLTPGQARVIQDKVEELQIGLDALAEVENLLLLQIQRVADGRELEKKFGVLLPILGMEVERALRALDRYIERLQSLGLQPKVPERLLVGGFLVSGSGQDDASGFIDEIGKLPPGEAERAWGLLLEAERVVLDADRTASSSSQTDQAGCEVG